MSQIAFLLARGARVFLLLALLITTRCMALEWKTPPDKITLLAINAHPDDEGIFFGGALPYYSGVLQVPTMLLSMTSGDWHTNNLLIRENELRNAAWTYGLRYEPLFPRFRDVPSGTMSGNPYTNKIDATWDYWADGVLQGNGVDVAAGRAKAINYVAEVIRRYRPEVIITHDFNGEYGHDNHKATAQVVAEAYYVAADPSASATNLVGMLPWQARKLYVHLYKTNQLFHTGWEIPQEEFGGSTARQIANQGLNAHVSQNAPDVSTYYLTGENFEGYDSEQWGLFASAVGSDTHGTNGIAYGNFLEHIDLTNSVNTPPEFFPSQLRFAAATSNQAYTGETLARFATDLDKVGGDILTFSKVGGPSWLTVGTNGMLTGTPGDADVGENIFQVRVTDSASAYDDATLCIFVRGGTLASSWNCNEAAGSIAGDTSGEDHHANLTASTSWTLGRDKGALSLNGNNAYGMSDNVNVGNAFTVAAWMCSSNLVGEHAILGENNGYTLKTSGTGLRLSTPGIRDHTYAANLVTGQWYHVAVTFEAGVSNGCKFYINGEYRDAINASTKSGTTNATWIGRNQWGQYFNGLLDDIRIYRAVLSASELAALFSNTAPTFATNLIVFPSAIEKAPYAVQDLTNYAIDSDVSDSLVFEKLSGPTWLNIAPNGVISGTPDSVDVGTNSFQVRVYDSQRAVASTTLTIIVACEPTFLLRAAALGQGGVRLVFTGEALRNYFIMRSSNLTSWTPIAQIPTDALGRAVWTDSAMRGSSFYRVQK